MRQLGGETRRGIDDRMVGGLKARKLWRLVEVGTASRIVR
jgi:hypothetical protein